MISDCLTFFCLSYTNICVREYIPFFGIGFNVPFNTFQVISGQCLLVTEGMITTLYTAAIVV